MELENKPDIEKDLLKTISQLLKWIMILILMILVLLIYIALFTKSIDINLSKEIPKVVEIKTENKTSKHDDFWHAPDINEITDIKLKEQITYGRDLIANTQSFFGTQGSVRKNAINGLNCQNCHLEAGTKVFGNNYSAVASTYPKYRARSGASENIYKRVNDCFERSLNGETLDTTSKEMQAITAYIKFLGKDVPKGEKPKGAGLKDLAFLDRVAAFVNSQSPNMKDVRKDWPKVEDKIGLQNAHNTSYTLHSIMKEYLKAKNPVTPTPPLAAKILDAPQAILTQVTGVDYQFR
jgi:thiosulfate dehydrogenase